MGANKQSNREYVCEYGYITRMGALYDMIEAI